MPRDGSDRVRGGPPVADKRGRMILDAIIADPKVDIVVVPINAFILAQHLPDAQGPEWAALVILVFTLVLFGVAPSIAVGPVDTATVPLLLRLGVLQ